MHSLTPNLCLDEESAKIESDYQTYIHIYIYTNGNIKYVLLQVKPLYFHFLFD